MRNLPATQDKALQRQHEEPACNTRQSIARAILRSTTSWCLTVTMTIRSCAPHRPGDCSRDWDTDLGTPSLRCTLALVENKKHRAAERCRKGLFHMVRGSEKQRLRAMIGFMSIYRSVSSQQQTGTGMQHPLFLLTCSAAQGAGTRQHVLVAESSGAWMVPFGCLSSGYQLQHMLYNNRNRAAYHWFDALR